jgi:heme-degrading monooxygenase HmoA
MVVEYIRYRVPDGRHEEFESAWTDAQRLLIDAPECVRYEVTRGIEEPDNYIVRIEWSSLDDHEQGFRHSPGFGSFFAAVKPFFDQIEEMRHYEVTPIASAAPSTG